MFWAKPLFSATFLMIYIIQKKNSYITRAGTRLEFYIKVSMTKTRLAPYMYGTTPVCLRLVPVRFSCS